MSNKRLQSNPLAHLVSTPVKEKRAIEKPKQKQSRKPELLEPKVLIESANSEDFKRHTFFIRRSHIRALKRLAFEQDRSIKDILDDLLVLGLKHLSSS